MDPDPAFLETVGGDKRKTHLIVMANGLFGM